MSEAPVAEPGTGRRVRRFLLLFLFYVAVGPPVGAMVFFTLVSLSKITTLPDLVYALMAPFMGLLLAPLSYMLGVLPAALGGLVVAAWQAFFGRVTFAAVLAIGFVLGLGFVHVTDGMGTLTQTSVSWWQVVTAHLTAMLPTVICWYPFRNLYYPPESAGGTET